MNSLEFAISVDTAKFNASISKATRHAALSFDGLSTSIDTDVGPAVESLSKLELPPEVAESVKKTTKSYDKLGEQVAEAEKQVSAAHKAMAAGAWLFKRGIESVRNDIEELKDSAKTLAVKFAFFGLATKEAMDFESAMANVRKVTEFETPGAFKAMTKDLIEMTRHIPIAAEGLAEIAVAGGQMGIATESIVEFTELVAQMATAFDLSANEAGVAVGKLMNVFDLGVTEARELSDAINHLGNTTNATERDIIEVMVRVGGMTKAFGLAKEEAAALSTMFLSVGLGPERAASAINALTREMISAPTQTEGFKNALLGIGLTANDLSDKIKQGPQQALSDLLQRMSQLDAQAKISAATELFGKDFADSIVTVVNNLGKYQTVLGSVADKTTFAGATQKEFGTKAATTASQMQLVKNSFEEVAIAIGNIFLPALQSIAKGLAFMAQSRAEFAEAFPLTSIALLVGGMAALNLGFRALLVSSVAALVPFLSFSRGWALLSFFTAGALTHLTSLALTIGRLALPFLSLTSAVGFLAAGLKGLMLSPIGLALTAVSAAMWVYSKATESAVKPLVDAGNAMEKSRKEAQAKIKTLEDLRKTLHSTEVGTEAHTAAEQKLAEILPGVNLSVDEHGRVLARVGGGLKDNTKALDDYIATLEKEDDSNFIIQLDIQARAVAAAKKELDDYTDTLKNRYGMDVGKATSLTQKLMFEFDNWRGKYQTLNAESNETRAELRNMSTSLRAMVASAVAAGESVEGLTFRLHMAKVDPETRTQIVKMFNDIANATEVSAQKVGMSLSSALMKPAEDVKKALVAAINVTDTQLSKYNESLGQHKEKLKQAVDDISKSYKTLSEAASAALTADTQKMDAQFEERRSNIKTLANEFFETEIQKSQFLVSSAERNAQAQNFSQESMTQVSKALAIEESEAKSRAADLYYTKAMALAKLEFQTKIDNAKRLGVDGNRLDEERLQAQKGVLERTQAAYKQSIDKLISEEKRHRDAAYQLAEQRKNFEASVQDKLASMAEKTMSDAEVYASRQTRIAEEQAKAEEALQAGNYEMARKYADKAISLAESTSGAVSQGGKIVVDSNTAAARSYKQIQDAAQIENQALREQEVLHVKSANALQTQTEISVEKLNKLQNALKAIDNQISQDHKLILDVDTKKIDDIGPKIDEVLNKISAVTKIKEELQAGTTEIGTMLSQALAGELDKVAEASEKVSNIFSKFKAEFSTWQPEVKANFDADAATDAVNGLTGKIKAFQEAARETEAHETVIKVKTDQSMRAIDKLIDRMGDIKDKVVTIRTEYVTSGKPDENAVEKHAAGGRVGFAGGGFLPGWGSKDDVAALLTRGEYVLNKYAVRFYGIDRLNAMNRMKLPRFAKGGPVGFKMPRFELGGLVRNLVIPEMPRLALAGGGPVEPRVTEVVRLDLSTDGRPSASIKGSHADIRSIVDTLRELERRMH